VFETATGRTLLNGAPVILAGGDLHQEIETKGAAMAEEDFRANFALMQDMGANWVRLAHYPRAQLEYDLCDQLGILCWAENGHTNGPVADKPGPTADEITTEMVKQNYNHPAIAVWSVGNEAGADVAEREVPVVKALDQTRPVVVANMKCANADFHGINSYPGWYGGKAGDWWTFAKTGYVTEAGAGGMTTIHTDYADAKPQVNKYEPEEYQQLVAEARFQTCIGENNGTMGMFTWWCMRDFTDTKYKGPLGLNTKGLLTYAGDKKDIYYLFRCFLRPTEPTVHITSQRYFVRLGAVDNGIKVYASTPRLTLTLNGVTVSTLNNGQYLQSNGHRVDHVFFWKTPLHTGKNLVAVTDGAGHGDTAVIYFYGADGLSESAAASPPVADLQSSNPKNPAYFMDMPVLAQWPVYDDLDATADNSFDTLPAQIEGARWIARRRVTKAGQESDLSFRLTRPATVYVMATRREAAPDALEAAGFKEVPAPGLAWRDNNLNLVAAQLFARPAGPGETIRLAAPDRDEIVLVKE
jgi:beta-galactosidase